MVREHCNGLVEAMTEAARQDCEALLSHVEWVRALARHLTSDAQMADDLAQDTLTAALVRPPPSDRPLRNWLAGILRNRARHEHRSAGHRSARELSVARDAADLSSAQLFERLETHRAVVEAVARLDEPYRAAILMRYFEGLSPAAIAAKTSTPLRTVHTRLHRALAKLRVELDRSHDGDRKAWLLALVPFARGSDGWSTLGVGALLMDAKLKIALAVVAVVGVCSTFALWRGDESKASPATVASAPEISGVAKTDAITPESPVDSARAAVDRQEPTNSTDAGALLAAPVTTPHALSGRVIDVERAPVAGVAVRYFDFAQQAKDDVEAKTDPDGAFQLDDPRNPGYLDVATPGWTCVLRPEWRGAEAPKELVLVVARSITLAGVVVDEEHHPLDAASVTATLPFSLRSRFDAILDSSSTIERKTQSNGEGRFELKNVPIFEGARLLTVRATYLNDDRALPAQDDLALEIVLRSAATEARQLVGQVVDLEGSPVEGAWVGLGTTSTKSGPSGGFALDLEASRSAELQFDKDGSAPLRAAKRGYLPAEIARPSDGRAWPEPLVLRLGGPCLSIAGRVVDGDGDPIANAEVWTDDETHFGFVEIEGGEMRMQALASVEGVLRGDPWASRVRTNKDGRFELRGLLARSYRMNALDKDRLLATTVDVTAGSHDVELRMPKEELYGRIAGRVTKLSGEPIEGVEVVLERDVAGVRREGFRRLESRAETTDSEGRFEFRDVSRSIRSVNVNGEELGILGFEHALDANEDVEHLEIAVPMRVHVQIDAKARDDFDHAALFDEHGEKLYTSVQHGNSGYAVQDVRLESGRSEPFSVSESATTLVLSKNGVEVLRMPVKLTPGELNTLRP